VKVIVVGERGRQIEAGLSAQDGVELVSPRDAVSDRGDVAELAAALRAYEALLEREGPERVVIAGSCDSAIAAVLVATKMRIPVGAVSGTGESGQDGSSRVNSRLIEQLADASLDGDPSAIAAWLDDPRPTPRAEPGSGL
jgi:hypothetical protein